jgi:hypothetical protein
MFLKMAGRREMTLDGLVAANTQCKRDISNLEESLPDHL